MPTSRRALVRSSSPLRCLALGLVAAVTIGASSAHAQYFDPFDDVMPPRAVVWRLNDRGFTEVTRPRFDGRAYVVEAESPNGGRVRLILDPRDGAVLGRVRLSEPLVPPPLRVDRPRGPYGWTEEDVAPRRREAERTIPPSDIPYGRTPDRQRRADLGPPLPGVPLRSDVPRRVEPGDPNALGLNPDAARRNGDPARRTSRLNPPARPAEARGRDRSPNAAGTTPAVRATPAATAPTLRPGEVPATKPEAPVAAVTPTTPAAVQPPAQSVTPATSDTKSGAPSWQDPPADAKRPVRVIDGATVVPGAGDKSPATQD